MNVFESTPGWSKRGLFLRLYCALRIWLLMPLPWLVLCYSLMLPNIQLSRYTTELHRKDTHRVGAQHVKAYRGTTMILGYLRRYQLPPVVEITQILPNQYERDIYCETSKLNSVSSSHCLANSLSASVLFLAICFPVSVFIIPSNLNSFSSKCSIALSIG